MGVGDAMAVDGKTIKGARTADGRQMHLFAAFLHQQGTVVAQALVSTRLPAFTLPNRPSTNPRTQPRPVEYRKQTPLGPRRNLRRKPVADQNRQWPASDGLAEESRHQHVRQMWCDRHRQDDPVVWF